MRGPLEARYHGALAVVPSSRYVWAIAVAWCGVALGLFLYLFGIASTDDYAGWIVAALATQIPAYVAAVSAPRHRAFGVTRALVFAIPAGIVFALAGFWLAIAVVVRLRPPAFLDLVPVVVAFGTGIVGLVLGGLRTASLLVRRPHPRGLARALVELTVPCVAATAAIAASLGGELGDEPGLWIPIAMPVAWVVPFWLVRDAARAAPDDPIARVV